MIYHTCPVCGSNLDPGEHCDCDTLPSCGGDITNADKSNCFFTPNNLEQEEPK